jgi:hypothetical protein
MTFVSYELGRGMTRTDRRKAERQFQKARRKKAKLEKLFREGYAVVRSGGWPEWSALFMTDGPGSKFCREVGADYWFANSRYQVLVKFETAPEGAPPAVHLSIKAHDKRCVHDWRDMQRIKNEILGPEAEGVEIYPAESRLMDEANQFHIYVMHPVVELPWGQRERTHFTPAELEEGHQHQAPRDRPQQREFEDHHNGEGCRPEGLIEWPNWALDALEKLGYPVRVKDAGAPCRKGTP